MSAVNGYTANRVVDKLPVEVAAEKSVIGSVLLAPETLPEVLKLVHPRQFFDAANRLIFHVIVSKHLAGEPIDPALILTEIRDSEHFAGSSASAYLAEIGSNTPTSAHAKHYANLVAQASYRRQLLDSIDFARASLADPKHSLDEIQNALRADLEAIGSADVTQEQFSLYELRKQFPALNPPVVDGLFRLGESANIISHTKVGKSWLAYSLALSVITGQTWLDRFNTARGKVLLVDNELHAATLADRIPKVAEALSILPDDYQHDLTIWPLRGKLQSLEQLKQRFDQIEPETYQLILLDAKYRFIRAGSSENDNAAETHFYNLVDIIAEKTGAAVAMVHHTSKGNQADKRVTDVGSGAGAQSRATDCHLVLREHEQEGAVVLATAVRSFAPVEPVGLRWTFPVWTADESLDTDLLAKPKGSRQQQNLEQKLEADRIKVCRALAGLKAASTLTVISKEANLSGTAARDALDTLLDEGAIRETETTIRGQQRSTYELSPEP